MRRSLLVTLPILVCLFPTSLFGQSGWLITTVDSAGDVGNASSLALTSDGQPRVTYGTNFLPGVLKHAAFDGVSWSIAPVDSPWFFGSNSLALDADDRSHIAYTANTNAPLKYTSQNGSPFPSWSMETMGNQGVNPSLALASSGQPHIACDNGQEQLLFAVKEASGSWVLEYPAGIGPRHVLPSLTLDPSGNPHLSVHEYGPPHGVRYARRLGGVWTIETVDSASTNFITYSSIALDASVNPHIVFNDPAGTLKYAVRSSSAWIVEVVAAAGGVVSHRSLAIDAVGNAHLAYYDRVKKDLQYAVRSAGGWMIQAVDTTGDVGIEASLVLDPYGRPRISWYDRTRGDLKYGYPDPTAVSFALPDEAEFELAVRPNPSVGGRFEILFGVPREDHVDLEVFDVTGRRVADLVSARCHSTPCRTTWNGLDDQGRPVAAGVYVLRLEMGGWTTTRRVTVIR